MICPNCNTNNRDSARFCDKCGYELPTVAPIAKEMFSDGNILLDGSTAVTIDLEGLEHLVGDGHDSYYGAYDSDIYETPYDAYPYDHYDDYRSSQFDGGKTQSLVDSYSARGNARAYAQDYAQEPTSDRGNTVQIPVLDEVFEGNQKTYYARDPYKEDSPSNTGKLYSAKPSKDPSNPNKKKLAVLITIIALTLILGAVILTYILQIWGGKSVPDVNGVRVETAEQTLIDAGFSVDIVYEKSDDIEGIVLSTDPRAGSRIPEGSMVTLNVSIARVIPDVVGMPIDEAMALLAQEGFDNIEQTTVKSNESEGNVLSITPEVGTRSKASALITITYAEPYRVPDVVGQSTENARTLLEAEGYLVSVAYVYTEDIEEGMVVSSDPEAGSALASGSEVTINIAKSRSNEVVSLTRDYLSRLKTFYIGNISYEMVKVDSVSFLEGDSASFTIIARKFETHSWFGQEPETRYGNNETIKGTITWNGSNEISSIDPSIR